MLSYGFFASLFAVLLCAHSELLCEAFSNNNPILKIAVLKSPTSGGVPTFNGRVSLTKRSAWNNDQEDKTDDDEEEEARLKVLASRRKTIRSTLKSAESLRNFRIMNGYMDEIDEETGKPAKSDSKLALTLSAFVIAAGAVTLRVGGRAALVSGLGLDFATENPELKENMDQFLSYASSLGTGTEALLFILAWTLVKVFCFDAGGIVLAFSSGILFGGVIQGAIFSAFAATVGSSVAYFLAKVDTPIRKKALELVEEYPSLRGIEKVVAEDGLKAVLTLRLAPLIPIIPIGAYNYIYGVTGVPFIDFAGGIFLGSLKPYLLDSYLGYFGKELIDGSAASGDSLQDIILLVVLGVSVLIGVFASQLAGETWESVTNEIELEKQKKDALQKDNEGDKKVVESLFGFDLPLWVVGAQISLNDAEIRVEKMIETEYVAQVWNCTDDSPPPVEMDPSKLTNSPETEGKGMGFDIAGNISDGFVLSPLLLKAFLKYSDPLYDDSNKEIDLKDFRVMNADEKMTQNDPEISSKGAVLALAKDDDLEQALQMLKDSVRSRLNQINENLMKLQ